MSYVLQIWKQPAGLSTPDSVEAVARQLDELHANASGGDERFIKLVQVLTGHFPCICSEEAQQIPESDWAWTDGPLDGRTSSAVYNIGLASGRLKEVTRCVVTESRQLGLNVFDEQAAIVYLADGSVLGATELSSGQDQDDAPEGPELGQIVFDRLAPLLIGHGFKARKSDRSFRRSHPRGWQEIDVSSWYMGFSINSYGRDNPVIELINTVAWQKPPQDIVRYGVYYAGQPIWMDEKADFLERGMYVVSRYSELEKVVEHAYAKVAGRLLPILERCTTIEGLDQLFNTPPITESIFFKGYRSGVFNLAIAHLAGNPSFDRLCSEIDENTANVKDNALNGLDTRKLIAHFRDLARTS